MKNDLPPSCYNVEGLTINWESILPGLTILQWNLLSTYLKGDTKSVLVIRGTCYQGWFMYMRYTQGQNEEYLLSRSVY